MPTHLRTKKETRVFSLEDFMAEITQRSVGLLSAGHVGKIKLHVPHCTLQLVGETHGNVFVFIQTFHLYTTSIIEMFMYFLFIKLIN